MSAGGIARHALPGQGAREQSAGVTLAGRALTTTEGGGGGALSGGGGGARVRRREEPPVHVCYPGALPRCGGEGDPTCARRRRDGGLARGTSCSGTCGAPIPLASGYHSPATGEGATSCVRVE